jgi:luciferase-like monooxygenase
MRYLKSFEEEVTRWPQISIHAHRFGGREFRFGSAELGHMHNGGIVDIPFPRSLRDALLAEGLAEKHHWIPDSGWISFHLRTEQDLKHALWLMRLSYLRYALKTASDPRELLNRQREELHLSPKFSALLEPFLPTNAHRAVTERIAV